MCHVIPTGSRLNDQRTLDFVVMTLADPLAPQTSGVVGLNPRLRFGDNTIETGDNAIAAISAADGWYRYTLSDAESDNAPCLAALFVDASDLAGVAPVREKFQIGPSGINNVTTDANLVSIDGKTTSEPGLPWYGAFRVILAKLSGLTAGGGTGIEIFRARRNDGGVGKIRITETNDGTNRTGTALDITDDV